MTKKRRILFQKTVSVVTGLLLVFQSLTPGFFISSKISAQDAVVDTPTPTVVPAPEQPKNNDIKPTAAPEILSPTPNKEISPTPLVEPTVSITPEPTQKISPTIEPQKEEPSSTPSDPPKEASPPETPTPTATETPTITPEPTPESIEQTCEQPSETRTTSDYDWSINEFAGTAETRNPVELGVTYVFPKNTNVSVTFTCLPKDTSKRTALKIEEIAISELKLPEGINSTTNYAYDITTGMKDGTFKYNVTLPKSENVHAEVSYIEKSANEATTNEIKKEDIKQIEESKIGQENNKVKVSDIDHFTIYIVTIYADAALTVEKTNYSQGETVYAKGTSDETKTLRIVFRDNHGTAKKTCTETTGKQTSCDYTLPTNADTGTWSVELQRKSDGNWSTKDTQNILVTAYTPTPVANPTLPTACCGLDIALVIDNSYSIDSTELGLMKTALKGFVTALSGTPTQFSVTRFGTNASVIQEFTSNTSLITTAIDSVTTGGGSTDWQKGIIAARGTFDPRTDKPNLIIFASDGNPTLPDCGGFTTCQADVNHAIDEANIAKSSPLNIRILALGIGGELSTDNLKAISGTVVNGSDISTTDVITTDFSGMAAKLAAFAAKTCGGKISVNKYIDNVQTGGGKSWSFIIDGTTTITTDANGQVASGTLAAGNHSIAEVSIPTGYTFDTASCTNGTLDKPNKGVKNIAITNDSIITCNFYNTANYTPIKICHATGNPSQWIEETPATLGQLQGHVGHQSGNDIIPAIPIFLPLGQNWDAAGQAIWNNGCAIPPAKGTLIVKKIVTNDNEGTKGVTDFSFQVNGGTAIAFEADGQNDLSLNPNTYSVTETPVTGYDITYSNCSGISLGAGETKTCTITNNDISPKLTVTKIVSGSSEPISSFPLFVSNVTTTSPVNSGQQYTINAGTWTVSETNKTGYTAAITGDCTTNGTITLLPGDVKACTITNTRDTGAVTFEKLVNDGSSVFGWTFTVKDANGTTVGTYHSGDSATLETGSYTVTESGGSHYAFQSTSGICTTNSTNGVTSMTVTKSGGTCTFNNVYVPYCGDGNVNDGEQCDDGNSVNTDTCTNACMNPTCGDGFVEYGVEECDEGADNDSSCTPTYGGSCNYCDSTTCKPITVTGPYCGDGTVNSGNGEQCDDNNITNGDGCSATCQNEPGTIVFVKDAKPDNNAIFTLTYQPNVYPLGDMQISESGNGTINQTFTNVPTGTYEWIESEAEGWETTGITCIETKTDNSITNVALRKATITLDPGEQVTCTITNTLKDSVITGQKYEDVDTDQIKDTGETGLSGWTIFIDANDNKQFDTGELSTVTDMHGNYSLSGLLDASVSVCEVQKPNWDTASEGLCKTVNPIPGQTITDVDFGNWKTAHIIIAKNLVPDAAGGWFDMYLDSTVYGTVNGDWTSEAIKVVAGKHTVREVGANGTILSDYATHFAGDCDANGSVTVNQGQTKRCTIVNTKIPVYTGSSDCPEETPVKKLVSSFEISSTDKNGQVLSSLTAGNYLFEATGSFVSSSGGNWKSDAGYSSNNNWSSVDTNYGIGGVAPNYGAHALLADLGEGVGIVKWGPYNTDHQYNFYTASPANPQFVIGDRWSDWYGTAWDNQKGMSDNSGAVTLNVYTCESTGTITIDKTTAPTADPQAFDFTITKDTTTVDTFSLADADTPHTNAYEAGHYTISESAHTNWEAGDISCQSTGGITNLETHVSPTNPPTRVSFDLAAGGNITCTFNNIKYGSVNVTKFNDLDGDGTWDKDTEKPMDGWEMNVNGQPSKITGNEDTGTGQAVFEQLTQGTYYLSETQREGWKQTGISCQNSGPGVTITATGEAYGHHGACEGWNGCGDAATCALWACEVNGYDTLVSYGEDKPCTQFNNCNLFHSRGNVQTNWGNWCNVQGVTDIICTDKNTLSNATSTSTIASTETHSSFFPMEKVEAQEEPTGYPVPVSPGAQVHCYVGNQYIPAKLEISKENNAIGDQSPGASILYTLTVKALDNTAYGVKVTDLLPKGFTYRGGSWTANSNKHGVLSLDEPTYHSPGTWNVGNIEKGEEITLTLIADVSTDEKPGTYKDLAIAYGCKTEKSCEIGDKMSVIATAVAPGYIDETYHVGTDVTIVKDTSESKSIAVQREGEVLGASTELPSTGANAKWIIVALSLIIAGLGAIVVSTKMRRYHA